MKHQIDCRICITCFKLNVPKIRPEWNTQCLDCYFKKTTPSICLISIKKDIKPVIE